MYLNCIVASGRVDVGSFGKNKDEQKDEKHRRLVDNCSPIIRSSLVILLCTAAQSELSLMYVYI